MKTKSEWKYLEKLRDDLVLNVNGLYSISEVFLDHLNVKTNNFLLEF
jgi:hypothetical protein